jgi:parallel beta-helix repeat protein
MRPASLRSRPRRLLARSRRVAGLWFDRLEGRTLPAGFLVDTTADSGPGSLRQAILDANGLAGVDEIDFDLPGVGVQTIAPRSELPWITDSVLIDGTSQAGSQGFPVVALDGRGVAEGAGLTLASAGSTVRGLVISGFAGGAGIRITGADATGNLVQGNFVGTDPTGSRAVPNDEGILLDAGASGNSITGNLVSGNARFGIEISSSPGNLLQGNDVGTGAAPPASTPVDGDSILVNGGFEDPVIPDHSWTIETNGIPGWAYGRGDGIEIQRRVVSNPAEGNNFVELAAGLPGNIFQNVSTTPGATYTLSFQYRPRPGYAALESTTEVWWGGQLITTLSGENLPWTTYTFSLGATDSTTRLEFRDVSSGDPGIAAWIDDVRLIPDAPPQDSPGDAGTPVNFSSFARRRWEITGMEFTSARIPTTTPSAVPPRAPATSSPETPTGA